MEWTEKVKAERIQLGLGLVDEVIRHITEPKRLARSTIHAVVEALGCGQDYERS